MENENCKMQIGAWLSVTHTIWLRGGVARAGGGRQEEARIPNFTGGNGDNGEASFARFDTFSINFAMQSIEGASRRLLFFLRENSLSAAPLYGHLVFRGVEGKDCRTLDLECILGRRFEGDCG